MRPATDYAWDLHLSGVHLDCRRVEHKPQDTPLSCRFGGAVERIHSHNFDGLLVCGCDDFAFEGVPS